jgi:hypothetical protein
MGEVECVQQANALPGEGPTWNSAEKRITRWFTLGPFEGYSWSAGSYFRGLNGKDTK